MLVPNEEIDRHREELVDHAEDGEAGGGDGAAAREAEEGDGQPEDAGQPHRQRHRRRVPRLRLGGGGTLDLLQLPHHEQLHREQQQRLQVVVQDQAPRVQPDGHHHVLDVDEVNDHAGQVRRRPAVRRHGELVVGSHVDHAATEDGRQGEPRPQGRPRLPQEQRLPHRHEQRHRRPEHDEGVHVGVEEQLAVGEEGEVEDGGGGEEPPHCQEIQPVALHHPEPPADQDAGGAGEVLQGGQRPRIWKLHDRPLVDDRQQRPRDAVPRRHAVHRRSLS